jgi:nucleotide-binding universal stress UspA family protein
MSAIVVGTDGSRGAEAAVEKVAKLMRGTEATVHVVCAYSGRSTLERLGITARQDSIDLRGVASDVLARAEGRLREAGLHVEKHAREGDPANVILEIAEEQGADLVVVGAYSGVGRGRFMLGGVPAKLSHHVSTSLLIVREQ